MKYKVTKKFTKRFEDMPIHKPMISRFIESVVDKDNAYNREEILNLFNEENFIVIELSVAYDYWGNDVYQTHYEKITKSEIKILEKFDLQYGVKENIVDYLTSKYEYKNFLKERTRLQDIKEQIEKIEFENTQTIAKFSKEHNFYLSQEWFENDKLELIEKGLIMPIIED